MAHLGRDVAAFVDGQLTPAAHDAAVRHLAQCLRCRLAIDDQRRLKAQMGAARLPQPPTGLCESLTAFALAPPVDERGVPRLAVAGVTVAAAVLLIVAVAYVAGSRTLAGDPVATSADAMLAAFAATGAPAATAAPATMRKHGWSCPPRLGDLRREVVAVSGDSVLVVYASAGHRLQLHEQPGVVDESALAGAEVEQVAGATVWVIGRSPAVVTWQAPDVVMTLVTDLDDDAWRRVIRLLPAVESSGAPARVGAGLDRLAGLLS